MTDRELDAAIAERVMGGRVYREADNLLVDFYPGTIREYTKCIQESGHRRSNSPGMFHPSTHPSASQEITIYEPDPRT